MPCINVLSPHVADLIAAGEVVERPASAVKELLENAVDAGARTVVLELRRGGREMIRVTDDGCGMAPEDAGVCFLRHATSKLHDERGLEAIGTLGFRGEALAAIASVSRISLTTRARGTDIGVHMELTAGDIETMEETGCPEGTTLLVRDLFYNTPARQKFLGSDRAEGLSCVQAALRCAMGHPEVSFRCLRDGQEEFFTPGDGKPRSAVYALLGREFTQGLLEARLESEEVQVSGFVCEPSRCRGNRSAQYFFVNGRSIRSRALQAALEQAYKNSAMVGKFPACVLYVTLPNGLVDVNVHPTKAEVKFAREKPVFDAVYYAVQGALHPESLRTKPEITREPEIEAAPVRGAGAPAPARESEGSPSLPASDALKQDFFAPSGRGAGRTDFARWERPAPKPAASVPLREGRTPYRAEYHPEIRVRREESASPLPKADAAVPAAKPAPSSAACTASGESPCPEENKLPVQPVLEESFAEEPVRFIGEALGVYALLERGEELLLIDKHAAHERIVFDRMRLNDRPLMSQELLLPETFSPDADTLELIEENLPLLERLGFVLESFGEADYALRAVPADIDAADAVPLLEELAEKLREGRSLSAADVWERLAASVACKAAIKAGYVTQPEELIALARRVLSGAVTHCPHGRPVMISLNRKELDKRFGRIV